MSKRHGLCKIGERKAGEMVKYLWSNHEDLSWDPQHPQKSWAWRLTSLRSQRWRAGTGEFWRLAGQPTLQRWTPGLVRNLMNKVDLSGCKHLTLTSDLCMRTRAMHPLLHTSPDLRTQWGKGTYKRVCSRNDNLVKNFSHISFRKEYRGWGLITRTDKTWILAQSSTKCQINWAIRLPYYLTLFGKCLCPRDTRTRIWRLFVL